MYILLKYITNLIGMVISPHSSEMYYYSKCFKKKLPA